MKLSWQDHVSLSETDGRTIICGPESRLTLPKVCPAFLSALHRLTPPGETEEKLEATILADGSGDGLPLCYRAYLAHHARTDGQYCRADLIARRSWTARCDAAGRPIERGVDV